MVNINLSPDQLASIASQQGGIPPVEPPYVPPVIPPAEGGIVDVVFDWNAIGAKLPVGPLSDRAIVACAFTTGNRDSPGNNLGGISVSEIEYTAVTRIAVLSAKRGSFEPLPFPAASAPGGTTVSVPFGVGTAGSSYYPQLEQNTTYYFNIRTYEPTGALTKMVISLRHPGI